MIKRQTLKGDKVKLTFAVPDEGITVSVAGDFNDWDASGAPLKKRSNGTRSYSIELPADGSVRFRYLDEHGNWFDDPEADFTEPNGLGETHSVIQLR
jgi:1,4-alpha-glucan branching enzyme